MIIAGTGHRPNKLGGYNKQSRQKLTSIAKTYLQNNKVDLVISGMALGWDTALAIASIQLNIPLSCYIPFKGQEIKWYPDSIKLYHAILNKADEVKYICEPGFANYKMQKRNEAMVNDCDILLAMWNGTNGGTHNCIKYANKINKPIVNLYDKFV